MRQSSSSSEGSVHCLKMYSSSLLQIISFSDPVLLLCLFSSSSHTTSTYLVSTMINTLWGTGAITVHNHRAQSPCTKHNLMELCLILSVYCFINTVSKGDLPDIC